MMRLQKFIERMEEMEKESSNRATINRNQELAGIRESNFMNRYIIQIDVQIDSDKLLLEHEQYKKFQKSTDLYYKHAENPDIPVKAHYHIVDNKSKLEIYAVNIDGTAHHRKNSGFEIPKKQADELRKLGVAIPQNNILESIKINLNESQKQSVYTFFIVAED